MDPSKQKLLEAAGWRIGQVAEFLGLSPAEQKIVEECVATTVPRHADESTKFRAEALVALVTAGIPEDLASDVFELSKVTDLVEDLFALWSAATAEEKNDIIQDLREAIRDEGAEFITEARRRREATP